MYRLKPFFLPIATFYWTGLSIATFYFFYVAGVNPPTLGMAISSFFPTAFIWSLSLRKKPRTSPSQLPITFTMLFGVLMIAFWGVHLSVPLVVIYSLGFAFWLLYLLWYSPLSVKNSDVLVPGKLLPDLHFKTYNNKPFYNGTLAGKKIVYIFYRGNWCPVCMTQVRAIVNQYLELKERGAEILLISPQASAKSKELAEKFKVDIHFLTDTNNNMAKLLQIEDINGTPIMPQMAGFDKDTVLPTVIITDELGKIIYLDRTDNYRVRPEPEVLIASIS